MYDLIAQGVTIALVIYFGLHLRQKLQTVHATVAAQEKAIAAQAEHMKAQSRVLQDVERLSKITQQVIDLFDPQTQLKREQAYRDRVDRDMKALEDETSKILQKFRTTQIYMSEFASTLAREATRRLQEVNLLVVESHTRLEKHNQAQ